MNTKTIEEVLAPFDKESSGQFTEYEVYTALRQLGEKDEKDAEKVMAECMAFMFHEDYRNDKTGWGTYYGPMYVSGNEDGTGVESPSLRLVTPKMIQYWILRADKASNPIIKARYAGLVFDFSERIVGEPASFNIAKLYVESLVCIVDKKLYKYESLALVKLRRALFVALSFKLTDLIERIKKVIIEFDKCISDDAKPWFWGQAFDLLVDNSNITLDKGIEKEIIDDLEGKLERATFVDVEDIDPSAFEAAAKRLARYYRKRGRKADFKRVLLKMGEAFNRAINEHTPAMQASAWLEDTYKIYDEFGLKEEAKNILIKLRTLGTKVNDEMKAIPFTFDMPKEKLDQFLHETLSGDVDAIMNNIIVQFIPNRKKTEQQVRELYKVAPLQFIVTHKIQDSKGRVVATIGPLEDDLEGHLMKQISQTLSFSSLFLDLAISEAVKQKNLKAEDVMSFLEDSPFTFGGRMDILKQGISYYFQKDYLASMHVLVPQIEQTLREIVETEGGNVLKSSRMGGGFHLVTFDELLREEILQKGLGENLIWYFRVLFTDPRGWNLRNNICHGLMEFTSFDRFSASRVIHAILCIGVLKKRNKP